MKKSKKSLSISAFILLLAGFIFTTTNVAFADDKATEATTKEATVADKATDADGKAADKKKGKDGEEPECE